MRRPSGANRFTVVMQHLLNDPRVGDQISMADANALGCGCCPRTVLEVGELAILQIFGLELIRGVLRDIINRKNDIWIKGGKLFTSRYGVARRSARADFLIRLKSDFC